MTFGAFKESFLEEEETAPHGGRMRWTVRVDEPDVTIGTGCAMVHVTEDTTVDDSRDNTDVLYLNLDDAERLVPILQRAIAHGRKAERIAADINTHHRGVEAERAAAYARRMREEP